MPSRLVFDIEADNLYEDATQIWCIVTKDIDTSEVRQYGPEAIDEGCSNLLHARLLIGHNIINYDVPLVEKLCGVDLLHIELYDTLVVSRLLNPDRKGGHSLAAWGQRCGRKKPEHEDWTQFSPEMLHRCTEDVEINHGTYLMLLEEANG